MKISIVAITLAVLSVVAFAGNTSYASPTQVQDTVKICPVSGETIDGSEGKPVTFNYLGKEYTFCCANCVEKFKKEPVKYIKDPIVCPVMGETADAENTSVYNGVTYYFCCKPCIKKFEKDPEKYKNGYKGN